MLTKRIVQTEYELTITREELLGLIHNQDIADPPDIPDYAEVTIAIPGGGDWGNMDLDLRDAPIRITCTWSTKVREG